MRLTDWLRRHLVSNGALLPDKDQDNDAEELAQARQELEEIRRVVREIMTERGIIQHRPPEEHDRERD